MTSMTLHTWHRTMTTSVVTHAGVTRTSVTRPMCAKQAANVKGYFCGLIIDGDVGP